MPTTARVPEAFVPLFDQAETYVRDHFSKLRMEPEKGTIHVGDERYVLVRATSLTSGFLEVMRDVIGEDEALKFWYRLARVIGRDDSRTFCQERKLTDPTAKLSTGPIHFAFAGWARVEIDDRSRPATDDTYYLEYTHPNTFESATFAKQKRTSDKPVCVFSAGYSAGWCAEAFGVDVHAREITCVAKGDPECRFVMAPWEKLDGYENEVRVRLGKPGD